MWLFFFVAFRVFPVLSVRVAQYSSSFSLVDHRDAVFMSVVPVPNSDGYVGFYRTSYASYQTGVAIMNASMAVVLDLGTHIGQCEDPRTFWWNDRLYVMDNHGWNKRKIFDVMSQEVITVEITSGVFQGKNWVPFVVDGILYFAFHLDPLCLLRCVKSEKAVSCQEVQQGCTGNASSQWRGGTSGLVQGDWVIGAGHRTVNNSYHRPFLYNFSVSATRNEDVTVNKEPMLVLGGNSHAYGIIDPTVLLAGPPLRMLTTDSPKEWFSPNGYRFSWYDIS